MAKLNITTRVKVGPDLSITLAQEKMLVDYLIKRFDFCTQIRDQFVFKLERIDREFAGYVKLSSEDLKRKRDTEEGKGVKPYDVQLPLVDVQIDEAVTLLMSILAPDSDVYGAITSKAKQNITTAIVTRMNEHADDFKHYGHLCKLVQDALKYNASAATVDWLQVIGRKLSFNETGGAQITNDVVKSGNEICAVDMYNFMWDVTAPFLDLAEKGEFFASFDVSTLFRIKKMMADGEIFNCERFLRDDRPTDIHMTPKYYKLKPELIPGNSDPRSNGPLDFTSILQGGQQSAGLQSVVEIANIHIWIDPIQFGLAKKEPNKENQMEIWKLCLINNKYIVSAERVDTAYGMLPITTIMPRNDGFGLQTRSQAEMLMPFQRFSSFQFNVHQRGSRAALYGKTFYDSRAVPEKVEDTEAGWIPVRLTGMADVDIRKLIMHVSDRPETQQTMDDISKINDLMQKVLPTDLLKQVTDLQRATAYQAAAVVQGSNRRGHKMAKLIDDQGFTRLRYMQFTNIIHHERTIMMTDDQGNEVEIAPSQAANLRIQFSISGGLRGLDKMYMIDFYKEMFFALIQSATTEAQKVDLLSMLDYIAGLAGDKMDLTQFVYKTPFDALPPDQKQAAYQLLQQSMQGNNAAPGAGAEGTMQPPAGMRAIAGGMG